MLVVLQQGRRLHGHCMHYSFIASEHIRVSQHLPQLHKCTNTRDNNNTRVNAHLRIHQVALAVSCVRCRCCCCCCAVVCALGCLFDGSASKDLGPLQQRKVTKAKPKATHHELALLAATAAAAAAAAAAALAGLPPYLRACHTTQQQQHHDHHTTKVLMINDTNITTAQATARRTTHTHTHPTTATPIYSCTRLCYSALNYTPLYFMLLRVPSCELVHPTLASTRLGEASDHSSSHGIDCGSTMVNLPSCISCCSWSFSQYTNPFTSSRPSPCSSPAKHKACEKEMSEEAATT